MKKKLVFVSHPISGDICENIGKIKGIIREINLKEPDVVPVASYFADVMALDDTIPSERKRGLENASALIATGIFDEIRLYGDNVSSGMIGEITTARSVGTFVRPMTNRTVIDYFEIF